VKTTQSAKVRLVYSVLRPGWNAKEKPMILRRGPGGRTEVVQRDVVWENGSIEWQATPGEYELRMAGK
jgi:hypothetical protein